MAWILGERARSMNRPSRRIYDEVPAVSDPRWAAWTLSLYGFLSVERNWDELYAWFDLHRKGLTHPLLQLLAYLSYSDLARYRNECWVACRQLPAEVSPLQVPANALHTIVVTPFRRQLSRRKGTANERA